MSDVVNVPLSRGDAGPRWVPILYGAFAAFVIVCAQGIVLAVCCAAALTDHGAPTRSWDMLFIAIEAVLVVVALGTLIVGFLPRSGRFVRLFARTAGIASVAVVVPLGIVAMALVQADLGTAINTATPAPAHAVSR